MLRNPFHNRIRPALLPGLIFALVLLGVSSQASAQAQPWNTNIISWDAPTQCTNGQPISFCPVVGYTLQRSPVSSGTYVDLGTTAATVLTFRHDLALAGVNCYRVIGRATPPVLNSMPSNFVCVTNTLPTQPNPPTNTRIVAPSVAGLSHSPAFGVSGDGSRSNTVVGFAVVGTPCEGPVLFRYRSLDYQRPTIWLPWPSTSSADRVAAPCVNAS